MKKFFRFFRSGSGFTLIEVLIVISITALLTAILLQYNHTGRQQIALMVERAKIIQVIYRARALAVSTFNTPSIPCGYGVHFDYANGSYSVASYNAADCNALTSLGLPGTVVPITTYTISAGVAFGAGAAPLSDVVFMPPNPTTVLWTSSITTTTNANVYLVSSDALSTSTISLNSAGQVGY